MQKSKKQHLINKEIRATEVRVSDVGILSLTEALRLAESDGLDLVLINPNAQPPVVKIMNYEKFLYIFIIQQCIYKHMGNYTLYVQ